MYFENEFFSMRFCMTIVRTTTIVGLRYPHRKHPRQFRKTLFKMETFENSEHYCFSVETNKEKIT